MSVDDAVLALRRADQAVIQAAIVLADVVDRGLRHDDALRDYRAATAACAQAVADLVAAGNADSGPCAVCGDDDHTIAEHNSPLDAIPDDLGDARW